MPLYVYRISVILPNERIRTVLEYPKNCGATIFTSINFYFYIESIQSRHTTDQIAIFRLDKTKSVNIRFVSFPKLLNKFLC